MPLDRQHFTSSLTKIFNENGLSKLLSREVSEKLFTLTEFMLSENEKYVPSVANNFDEVEISYSLDGAVYPSFFIKTVKATDI